tara:strand:+ start:1103 stop:3988 length:2886 start_codon:yes stop_codon:yes gene_type:complete
MAIKTKAQAQAIARAIKEGKATGQAKERAMALLRDYREKSQPSTTTELISAPAQGFNTMVGSALGGVGDLGNLLIKAAAAGLDFVGVPGADTPRLLPGSADARRGLKAVNLGYENYEDLPLDQQALARGGEAAGLTATFAAPFFGAASRVNPAQVLAAQSAPVGAARAVPETVRNLAGKMVKDTAQQPGRMAAVEAVGALAAGSGRTLAEASDPGNETLGMMAETFTPMGATLPLLRGAGRAVQSVAGNFSEQGREQAASKILKGKLTKAGFLEDDQQALAKQLLADKSSLTPAQATGNPVLTQLENTLVRDGDEKLKTAISTQTKKAADELNTNINKLSKSSNPLLVREGQKLRINQFKANLDNKLNKAQERADTAVATILGKNSDDARNASEASRKILDSELKQARALEAQLWGKVDKNVKIPNLGLSTIKKTDRIKAEMLPEEKLPAPIESFVNRLRKNQKVGQDVKPYYQRQSDLKPTPRPIKKPSPITAKELFRARSRALEMAREAKAKMKFGEARRMNEIADSMLDDLLQVTDDTAIVAREFSKDLNEKFNNQTIRNILNKEMDVSLETASRGVSDTQRALNFAAMKRATQRSIETMENPTMTNTLDRMQKQFMQNSAAKTVNAATGKIEPKALSNFIRDNAQTIKEVGLVKDLADVEQKVKLAGILEKTYKRGKLLAKEGESVASRLAFGKGTPDNPNNLHDAILHAKTSLNQEGALRDLVIAGKRGANPKEFEALQHAVFDDLINSAKKTVKLKEGEIELISGANLENILNKETGKNSYLDNLVKTNLITKAQADNLTKVLIPASKQFEQVIQDPAQMERVITYGDGMMNLLARWSGSQVGASSVAGQGAPLMMAQAVSRKFQQLFDKIPMMNLQRTLTKAIQDKEFAAMLLTKPKKRVVQSGIKANIDDGVTQYIKDIGSQVVDTFTGKRINAYLLQQGLIDSEDTSEDLTK